MTVVIGRDRDRAPWENERMPSPADSPLPSGRRSLAATDVALGPLDGRYRVDAAPLVDHLSEAALNRNRVHVEVEWFLHLAEQAVLPGLAPVSAEQRDGLRAIVTDFGSEEIAELAAIERETVHDT